MKLSHRLAIMEQGKILQCGAAEELFFHPVNRAVAAYMGQVNYVRGDVAEGVFRCPFAQIATDKPDGAYDLAVRPFAVGLTKGGNAAVQNVYFKGERVELEIAAADNTLTAQMPYDRWQQERIAAGDKVRININAANPLLFPVEEN